jgi:hypothetical protein
MAGPQPHPPRVHPPQTQRPSNAFPVVKDTVTASVLRHAAAMARNSPLSNSDHASLHYAIRELYKYVVRTLHLAGSRARSFPIRSWAPPGLTGGAFSAIGSCVQGSTGWLCLRNGPDSKLDWGQARCCSVPRRADSSGAQRAPAGPTPRRRFAPSLGIAALCAGPGWCV